MMESNPPSLTVTAVTAASGDGLMDDSSLLVLQQQQQQQALPTTIEKAQHEVIEQETRSEPQQQQQQLSLLQSVQTIGYRTSLFGVVAVYALQLLLIPFLQQEAGLSVESMNNIVVSGADNDFLLLRGLVLASTLLAPRSSSTSLSTLMTVTLIASGLTTVLLGGNPASIGIAALCLREITYFGIAYKVEAVLCIILTPLVLLMFSSSPPLLQAEVIPLSEQAVHLLMALSLSVLVFGKFLEPLEEDWEMNQSEFLSKNRMD